MDIMSTGQLRAQSISIQVSDRIRCNAGCKFCISRTTPGSKICDDKVLKACDERRLRFGLRKAERFGASDAILTGKADPTQEDPAYLRRLVKLASEFIPGVDMHTNGLLLQSGKKGNLLTQLVDAGLTMVTFSIASFDSDVNRNLMGIKQRPEELIRKANDLELLVRCSLVVNKQGVYDFAGIIDYIRSAGELGAHMVVVREVWIPEVYSEYNKEVFNWNKKNKILIKPLEDEFVKTANNPDNPHGLQQRDPLPWGTPVFAVGGIFTDKNHGVNVTFARCDEATKGPVIKSIIHKPDGHGYRNWDHNGDILY